MTNKNLLLIVFLLFSFFKNLNAQVNVTVGYDLGFRQFDKLNAAIGRYNTANPNLASKMRKINNMSALIIGGTYKLSFFTLEANYTTRFKTVLAKENLNGKTQRDYLKANDQSYSLGFLVSKKAIGLGAAFAQHNFRLAEKFRDKTQFSDIFSQPLKYNSLSLYLDFKFKLNNLLGFHARPYYQIPLGSPDNISINNVEQRLNLPLTPNSNNDTNWGVFGIKIIFSNGKQD
jgi:hypothetical protein